MARDALGWRGKIAVAGPSTNTILQPDFDALRPPGVTNHFGRIHIPNMPIRNDEEFVALLDLIRGRLEETVDTLMTCVPDRLIMGTTSLMVWDGRAASEARVRALADHAGVPVSAGSFALEDALNRLGAKRIAIVSPYQPVMDDMVIRFFADCGFEVAGFRGLRCESPLAIAEVSADELRGHLLGLDNDRIDALVQVGTNLSMVALAAALEQELGKPVLAVNAATYWHALRAMGIDDRRAGVGEIFSRL